MIVNVNITGSGREAHVGGVAGKMRSVRIKEVYIGNTIVKVAGQEGYVGGVAGHSLSNTIQNVTVIDSIISGARVGGIVGYSKSDKVSTCHVIRTEVKGRCVGGVIGCGEGSKMEHATVASSTIIADTDIPSIGGGIGSARDITAVDLTVIDTVISAANSSSRWGLSTLAVVLEGQSQAYNFPIQ
ncbi:MAG: hypothetical protein QS721_00015 [Candidatus Endonucleobacter sp. (ex Gigantidas childressi)]|nr:hypothetical protein [Candidatus Endonucleobacter sp. (ex Gigantidas childressi)]